MENRANKKVRKERMEQILTMLNKGMYQSEIVYILSEEWKCSERNVEKYITGVYKLIASEWDSNVSENILAKYIHLYNKANERNDIKNAKSILDSIAKINNLGNKIDITSGGEKLGPAVIVYIEKPE